MVGDVTLNFSRAKQHEEAPPQGCQVSPGNGNYCSILGLCRNNGKENGNYHSILGLSHCLGLKASEHGT